MDIRGAPQTKLIFNGVPAYDYTHIRLGIFPKTSQHISGLIDYLVTRETTLLKIEAESIYVNKL